MQSPNLEACAQARQTFGARVHFRIVQADASPFSDSGQRVPRQNASLCALHAEQETTGAAAPSAL